MEASRHQYQAPRVTAGRTDIQSANRSQETPKKSACLGSVHPSDNPTNAIAMQHQAARYSHEVESVAGKQSFWGYGRRQRDHQLLGADAMSFASRWCPVVRSRIWLIVVLTVPSAGDRTHCSRPRPYRLAWRGEFTKHRTLPSHSPKSGRHEKRARSLAKPSHPANSSSFGDSGLGAPGGGLLHEPANRRLLIPPWHFAQVRLTIDDSRYWSNIQARPRIWLLPISLSRAPASTTCAA